MIKSSRTFGTVGQNWDRIAAVDHHNRFVIRNDLPGPLTLNIEPEGAFFSLGEGEDVSIFDEFTKASVTVKLTKSDAGDPIFSIWPGDAEVKVEKNGVDVFDLLQMAVE